MELARLNGGRFQWKDFMNMVINPLNAELNPIGYLLVLLGAHRFLHVSRVRVKDVTAVIPLIIVS